MELGIISIVLPNPEILQPLWGFRINFMQVGIIGLPNVGKSTLFKALTKKQVDASNYPFCTIDPNVGVVEVPDLRLEKIFQITKSERKIPTVIEFVDIAGLVKNAHQGEGLGNQFLSHIREVDALVEVVRDFEDKNVVHVEGEVNPQRDQDIIMLELIMADLGTVEKRLEKTKKQVKAQDKQAIKVLKILESLKDVLSKGKPAAEIEFNEEEKLLIKDLNLLTLKPLIYVLNIDNRRQTTDDKKQTTGDEEQYLEINAKLESELADLSPQETEEYLIELGIQRTGLDKLILESYKVLNLITFFTSGLKETRAWTIKKETKAPAAAGKIHTDFEKGFIKAEVIGFQDFISSEGELKAKEKGLMRIEGKDYIVKDGDVIYFKVNPT